MACIYIYTECITLSSPKMSKFGVCFNVSVQKINAASEKPSFPHLTLQCNWTTSFTRLNACGFGPCENDDALGVCSSQKVRFGWHGLGRFCVWTQKGRNKSKPLQKFFRSILRKDVFDTYPLYGNTTIFPKHQIRIGRLEWLELKIIH